MENLRRSHIPCRRFRLFESEKQETSLFLRELSQTQPTGQDQDTLFRSGFRRPFWRCFWLPVVGAF